MAVLTNSSPSLCAALERIFSLAPHSLDAELRNWYMHDWQSDPYTLGAYSYAPIGAFDCSEAMTLPLSKTLFFAGEHTDITGHWGTVHGALRSGLRAAEQLLSGRPEAYRHLGRSRAGALNPSPAMINVDRANRCPTLPENQGGVVLQFSPLDCLR